MPPEPFRYHMTRSALGLVFTGYSFTAPLRNPDVQALIVKAARKIDDQIANDPHLAIEVLVEPSTTLSADREIFLQIEPKSTRMTYGDLSALMPLLIAWAEVYESHECDFDIWALPGTALERRLGTGHFVLAV